MSTRLIPVWRLAGIGIMSALLIMGLAACDNDDSKDGDKSGQGLGLFEWDRSPDAIVFRMDDQPNLESPAYIANDIPLCTLWGDGRLVWVNPLINQTEVLEARLSEDQIRTLIETVIRTGFYDWQNDLVPPGIDNPVIESITLNLYDSTRTVERYSNWPVNGFAGLLDSCRDLSEQRARVEPGGGWMNAYEVPLDGSAKTVIWPRTAPLNLSDLAASGAPQWVEGPWAAFVWQVTRESGQLQVREEGRAYEISLQVPRISRDAPPAPATPQPQ
jgi:hypothetical protein